MRQEWSLTTQNRLSDVLACINSDPLFQIIAIWLLAFGVAGFLLTGVDKARAVSRGWRIPEAAIFAIALVGGAIGVGAGMLLFHHKTSKPRFLIVYVPILVLWLAVLQQIGFLGCLGTVLS